MKTECENHAGMDGYARLKADCAVCREMALEREEKPAEKGLFTTGYYDALKAAMRPLKGSSDAPENHIIDDWLESLGPVQHWDAARGCTALTQNDPGKRPHGYQPPAIEKSEPHPAAPLPGETEEHRRIRTFDSPYPATSQDAPIPYTVAKAWCPDCGGKLNRVVDEWECYDGCGRPGNENMLQDHEVWRRWEDTDKADGEYWVGDQGVMYLHAPHEGYLPRDTTLVIGPLPQPKAPK